MVWLPNNIYHVTIIQKQDMIACLSETEIPSSAAKKVTMASGQASSLGKTQLTLSQN